MRRTWAHEGRAQKDEAAALRHKQADDQRRQANAHRQELRAQREVFAACLAEAESTHSKLAAKCVSTKHILAYSHASTKG